MPPGLIVRDLGTRAYRPVWEEMTAFTRNRDGGAADEIWLLQHEPVYTLGVSCRDAPSPGVEDIPVVHCDRGGQITYHGPGQLIAYLLLDIKRRNTGPRSLVRRVEQLIIDFLAGYGLHGQTRAGAPGVYVDGAKIAALGLRISRGCCYHGLSLNVDVDLAPFGHIHPCGYRGLRVTRMADLAEVGGFDPVYQAFRARVTRAFSD